MGGRNAKEVDKSINYGNAQDFEIWEVARAATAAPFFFEPLELEIPRSTEYMRFTDAGISDTNNPTLVGTKEIERANGTNSIGIVVSVGSARRDENNPKKIFMASKAKLKDITQNATDTRRIHDELKEKAKRTGFSYYRLNDPKGLKMKLDNWEPKRSLFNGPRGGRTIENIEIAFNQCCARTHINRQLEECAAELVRCRKSRVHNRAAWERFATGAKFTCRFIRCEREDFFNREQFRHHLEIDHGVMQGDLGVEEKQCKKNWRYQPLHPH